MSFILDALKKSESERQQQGPAEFASVPSRSESSGPPRWLWVLMALLAVNIAVLAGLFLRNDSQPTTVTLPLDESLDRETATLAMATPDQPAVETPPEVAAAREALDDVQLEPLRGADPTVAAPAPAAAQADATMAATSFRDRVDEALDDLPAATSEPATLPEPEPQVVASTPAPQSSTPAVALPTLGQLRAGGIVQLPDLHLDIHVYSETPAERFVFINMVKHRENTQLAAGPTVEQITPDGVVLDHRGTRFLLPRE